MVHCGLGGLDSGLSVVYHIHYLAYYGLPYTLFGLVLLYIWFTVDLDSGLTGDTSIIAIYIIWLSVDWCIDYLA